MTQDQITETGLILEKIDAFEKSITLLQEEVTRLSRTIKCDHRYPDGSHAWVRVEGAKINNRIVHHCTICKVIE